jgi:glyoxylase-like metal-dependent hydrolase (beta-lactamase superfamily II)
VGDLRHILLTHVHLDHAGATGSLVQRNPKITVHVHEDGAPHLADPEKLVASTRRTFGEAHDRLWGEVVPVPPERIEAWSPSGRGRGTVKGMRVVPTPGHTPHHLAYLAESDGTLFAGDSLGIILAPGAPTHPPTPPPGLDVPAWLETLGRITDIGPDRAAVTHFGVHSGVAARALLLGERLLALEERVRAAVAAGDEDDASRYEEEVRAEIAGTLPREQVDRYFDTFGAATDWAGMRRFVERNPSR